MSIIDLSMLTEEPLVIKFSEEDTFTIPPEPKVEMVLQVFEFEEKASKAKSHKQQFDLFVKMVLLILKQDKSKDINEEFIKTQLSLSQMKKVVEIYQGRILENQKNPN